MRSHRPELVATELVAVVLAMRRGAPHVLTVGREGGVAALPAGPLRSEHRTLQAGLRAWVQQLTGHRLGYAEQLYTFADRERFGTHQRIISVSYLGLAGAASEAEPPAGDAPHWRPVYDFLPLEDRRSVREPESEALVRRLREWAHAAPAVRDARLERIDLAFGYGPDGGPAVWAPEGTLARYELSWEAGLVAEAHRDGVHAGLPLRPETLAEPGRVVETGEPMLHDHRRILATGLSRLRTTLQYRPVVFELMPDAFTLRDLQDCIEAVSGTRLHTQNFRRLVLGQNLVEPTGAHETGTGGRPARLFRFRRDVVGQRSVGLTLPRSR